MNSAKLIEAIHILDRYRDSGKEDIWFEHQRVILFKTDRPLSKPAADKMIELGFKQYGAGIGEEAYKPNEDWIFID
jgi:hypothetical protein